MQGLTLLSVNILKLALALLMITTGLYFMGTIAASTFSKLLSIDEKIDKIEQPFKVNIFYKDSKQYILLLWIIQPDKEEKVNAIRKPGNIEGNKQLYERGFHTDYNQASIENDSNRYA